MAFRKVLSGKILQVYKFSIRHTFFKPKKNAKKNLFSFDFLNTIELQKKANFPQIYRVTTFLEL